MSTVVNDINGNNMHDVYRRLMMLQSRRVLPPQIENEILDVQTNSSFDDFNDVNDEMLGLVFNLVSQYEKMGGNTLLSGSGIESASYTHLTLPTIYSV